MMKTATLNIISMSLVLLSGCDSVRDTLGLKRSEPDEFNIIERHHLTTPPGYGLRPPLTGQSNPAVIDPHVQAQQSITGSKKIHTSAEKKSNGEKALLSNLSTHSSEKDIRTMIANEQQISQDAVNNRLSDLSRSQTNNKELLDPHAEYEEQTGHPHPSKFLDEVN